MLKVIAGYVCAHKLPGSIKCLWPGPLLLCLVTFLHPLPVAPAALAHNLMSAALHLWTLLISPGATSLAVRSSPWLKPEAEAAAFSVSPLRTFDGSGGAEVSRITREP